MSQTRYKKTYEGDYTKSYKDYAAWAKETAQKKIEHQTISKQTSASYNKEERSKVYDITGRLPKESERVYAEGGRREDPAKKVSQNQYREAAKAKAKVAKPQPAPIPNVEPKKTTQASSPKANVYDAYDQEDDGNYNFYNPPIQQIGAAKYRNLKTNKEIGINEARNVLKMAGYTPKKGLGLGTVFFVLVIANIAFSMVAPFLAIGYGLFRMYSSSVTWVKQGASKFYSFTLPATPEEADANKKLGQLCILAGVVLLVVRYYSYLF